MSTTNTPATAADTRRHRPTAPASAAPGHRAHHAHPPPQHPGLGAPEGWRTVDLLTVAFLGAAFGIAYWGWGLAYKAPADALSAVFPPLTGLFAGPWLMAGVVGGLVIRDARAQPSLCEVIAALVSMLPGTQWGATTLVSGIVQGLGAELAFALLGYGAFGIGRGVARRRPGGAARGRLRVVPTGPTGGWAGSSPMRVILTISGAVVAGAGGWLLTKALARAGALGAFPAGQEERESRAV